MELREVPTVSYVDRHSNADLSEHKLMSQSDTLRQRLIKADYEPVSSSRKLNLLLQRSVRYSYRQRCCKCCPTILCELLFPFVLILLLGLSRYGINQLSIELQKNGGSIPGNTGQRLCSENSTAAPTSSEDIFRKCFQFPPSYIDTTWSSIFPSKTVNRTSFVFQPISADVNDLVQRASTRLAAMGCASTEVWYVLQPAMIDCPSTVH